MPKIIEALQGEEVVQVSSPAPEPIIIITPMALTPVNLDLRWRAAADIAW